MKRPDCLLLILFFLLCTTTGCESIDMNKGISFDEVPEAVVDFSFNVSPRTASYFVEKYASQKEVKSIDPIIVDGDTIMYLVNFLNENGWMILSADKRVYPILTEHDKGNFPEKGLNNGMNIWFTTLAEEISYIKKNRLDIQNKDGYYIWSHIDRIANLTQERQKYYDDKYKRIPPEHYTVTTENGVTRATINPEFVSYYEDINVYLVRRLIDFTATPINTRQVSLLPTKWGQEQPWNVGQFPLVRKNGIWVTPPAGCQAVAMGQVLYSLHYYLGKPNGLFHNVNYSGLIYDEDNKNVHFERSGYVENSPLWDQMALSDMHPTSRTTIVGDFLEDIGYRIGMKYDATGSGTKVTTAHYQEWGILSDEADYSFSTALGQVMNDRVVHMTGYRVKKTTGIWPFEETVYTGGHAWVVDGYVEKNLACTRVYQWELTRFCPSGYAAEYYDPYICDGDPYYVEFPNEDPLDYCGRPCDEGIRIGDQYNSVGWEIDWLADHYPGQIESENYESQSYYITINWGDNGENDGAYAPGSALEKGNIDYQYKQRMFYNFR